MPDTRDPSARPTHGDDVYVVDTRKAGRRSSPRAAAPGPRQDPPRASRPTDQQGGRGSGPGAPTEVKRTRLRKGRAALLLAAVLIIAWLAFLVWVPVAAWGRVERVDNAPGSRPVNTAGYNYLLVGSDSREGLTTAQRKALGTGTAEGKRTDTIMLVHISESGGKPIIVSIPRDSYVPIPGHGSNKINAAFALGGAKLLTETVEQVTGVYIDGYVEIGFAGFAGMVDGLGGVYLCVPRDMVDPKGAHINLKKGCQVLSGPDALGYVRSRYEDPLGDIGRANRQRQFLGAVMKQAATPSTVLLPWRYKSVADAVSSGLIVGQDTSLRDAIRVLQAMRAVSNDQGLSLGVPTSDLAYPTDAGLAVKWDTEKARALFQAIKNDEPLTQAPPGTTTKEPGK